VKVECEAELDELNMLRCMRTFYLKENKKIQSRVITEVRELLGR